MTVEQYIANLPEERRVVIEKLREAILQNLPEGFEEGIGYKMLSYHVPHSLYPSGYHCDPNLPLPFLNIASQKGHIGLYHMGLYADSDLLTWFQKEYTKVCTRKLDMGKCCVRFKKLDEVPYELIGQLVRRMNPQEWIELYEQSRK